MSDYSDFLRHFGEQGRMAANAYDWWSQFYDRSHGSQRYWLSKTPPALIRKWEDEARSAQEEYDNTHTDPQYINHYGSPTNGPLAGIAGAALGVTRMARSLADVFAPEIVENVRPRLGHFVRRGLY